MNNSNNASTSIEPVFYFGLNKKSQVPDELLPAQLKNYFEYSLKQNPKDLSRHLQRIQFALTQNSKNELFTALCDLFIILGTLGQSLRQRVLRLSKNKLDQHQVQLLLRHMQDDNLDSDQSSLPDNCLFREQSIELIKFCERSIADTQEAEDIFHTADSYIENSQFDTALKYMAQHLEQDLDNVQMTIKLIALYKALDNVNEFQKAYEQFANNLLTSRYWDEARQYFLDQQ